LQSVQFSGCLEIHDGCVYICRLIALPIGRHFKLRENVTKPVPHNDTLEKLFKQHRKIYPSDSVILVNDSCLIDFFLHVNVNV